MLTLIIVVVLLCLLIFLFGKFLDKFFNPKTRALVIAVLWILTGLFGYLIYDSIQEPIRFDKLKEKRYQAAVNKMLDIKKAQLAYKEINKKYTDNLDSLVQFIESAEFTIIERKDTSVIDVEKNRIYGISVGSDGVGGYFKDVVVTKEIGKIKVKDSLFKNSDRYKRLNVLKIDGIGEIPVTMKAGFLKKGEFNSPVFEARINKEALLTDQKPYLVAAEKKTVSVEGINGEEIILGSLEELSMAGNWPKKYGKNE